jgi:hypothetical protein
MKKGLEFYISNFFESGVIPKYYHNSLYPIDATSAAQSVISLTNFGYLEMAKNVALWIINNMQDEEGFFYYQINKLYKNKISYMRWSNAWMFLALSRLIYEYERV